ncbi:hypothetical protein BGW36DRAFT_377269 [Talaromyces proteolyticus]|uniref:Uncharacterized protein n=1 Tax=Talaromyces proteolyticus TaxID=1131652 RepID=A0AAD4KTQ3_9EURO|nr:uncharacterized protein BGW36DRAFT_377269 [Talaromyces proteolyticus]KAH8699091.1 hypothetical protein BGW36DRAFT_377269 [Talaromyces proteolyticus]
MDFDRPQSPEPIRSGSFTYSKNGIAACNISRAPLSELKQLFRKNASSTRVAVATRPWLTAQLQLYGIPFQKSRTAPQLKATLEDAVRAGKCNSLAPSIAAFEKSLSEEYQQQLAAHSEDVNSWKDAVFSSLSSPVEEAHFDLDRFMAKYFLDHLHGQPAPEKTKEPLVLENFNHGSELQKATQAIPGLAAHTTDRLTVVGWATELQRGIDTAFANLSSPDAKFDIPTLEAAFDLDRFLGKYFLNGLNGKPAPSKTPNPITLDPFFRHISKLEMAVASIPGLNLCMVEGIFNLKYTVIGWDLGKIKLRVREIAEKKTRYKAEKAAEELAEKEKRWQEILQPHQEYKNSHRALPGPLALGHLAGSYVVRCEPLEGYYDEGAIITLNIMQPSSIHGTTAVFDFGMIEGTMLLALSHDALEPLRLEMDVDSDEEELDRESDSDDYTGNRKRKKKESNNTNQIQIKRRLGETPVPNRLYFQWAGRETGNGEIQTDPDNKHTGYLDFNEGKTSARGEFLYPAFFLNEKVKLEIYKVADQPSGTPARWSSFSEKQWDYECDARWGKCRPGVLVGRTRMKAYDTSTISF